MTPAQVLVTAEVGVVMMGNPLGHSLLGCLVERLSGSSGSLGSIVSQSNRSCPANWHQIRVGLGQNMHSNPDHRDFS